MNPFAAIFVPDELRDAVSDRAWLAALLEAERALVNAQALAGLVDASAAAAVADACDPGLFDVAELAEAGRAAGNPVMPLVHGLRQRVGEEHAAAVHRGATSQDILDSAAMLVAKDALRLVDGDLARAADACAGLAERHRGSVMAARTLLQQAVPTTFGCKAAVWLGGLLDARDRLAAVRASLPVQLGGAGGTLAAFGEQGPELVRLYAAELDLEAPALPWHAARTPLADLAGACATAAGAAEKIAGDVLLLAQTEVAEVADTDAGGSSTMPHKRNPTGAVLVRACAGHARANASVLFESMAAEHERAAGSWHAEWAALTTMLGATGGAVSGVARTLEGLRVDPDRMRANIDPATLSEAERFDIAAEAPEGYLGAAEAFVDRALERHRG